MSVPLKGLIKMKPTRLGSATNRKKARQKKSGGRPSASRLPREKRVPTRGRSRAPRGRTPGRGRGRAASAPCAQDVLASSGVLALCEGRLLLSGKSVVQDEATLRLANVAHIVGLTPQPMPPPPAASGASYSHVAVGGGSSHADTVRRIRRALVDASSAAVLATITDISAWTHARGG